MSELRFYDHLAVAADQPPEIIEFKSEEQEGYRRSVLRLIRTRIGELCPKALILDAPDTSIIVHALVPPTDSQALTELLCEMRDIVAAATISRSSSKVLEPADTATEVSPPHQCDPASVLP